MQLSAAVEFWAQREPERAAIAVGGQVVRSYAALHNNITNLAVALAAGNNAFSHGKGLQKGARVVLLIQNTPEFFECLLACWSAGLVPVPVNTRLHPRELRFIVKHCGASLALSSESLTSRFIEAGCPVLSVQSEDFLKLRHSPSGDVKSLESRASRADDIAWLFYTSGTTGRPKGAALSFTNLEAMSRCYFRDVDVTPPWMSILHPAPLSHGSGLYSLPHFLKGSCQVLPESTGFDADEVCTLINTWPDSVFFAAPTMIRRLTHCAADVDPSLLKCIVFGGAPMYFEDIRDYLRRFGPRLAQLYGQGESPMTITAYSTTVVADSAHPRWRERITSAGVAQSAVNVRCVDEAGRELPAGELGEVVVQGETVMQYYWDDKQATREAVRNGWLWTGDIGSLDEEGFLTLKDRSKDLVISGGSNIYPREIEEVLLTHSQVEEVSVIGAADREWGEIVVAYVVARSEPGPLAADVLSRELDEMCLATLARFKRPRHYRFISELPKNNYGKILKTRLREMETDWGSNYGGNNYGDNNNRDSNDGER